MSNENFDNFVDNVEESEINQLPTIRDNLLDILPKPMQKRITEVYELCPDPSAGEILKVFKEKKIKLTETIETLRDAFWLEYDKAVKDDRQMNMANVYHDICPERTWRSIYQNTTKLAYIISPIIKYDARLNAVLRANAVGVLSDIMKADMYDEHKKIIPKIAALKLQAIRQIEDRIQGTPTQRTEIKQMNLSLSASKDMTLEELQREVAKLDAELTKHKSTQNFLEFTQNERTADPTAVDVTDAEFRKVMSEVDEELSEED